MIRTCTLISLITFAGVSWAAEGVVLFLGDGMGVSTVTAARIYSGQKNGAPGEEGLLSFEAFDHLALIKTYNTDRQVPDSAGTMTAIVTGEKTRSGVLSVNKEVARGNCTQALAGELSTLLEEAEAKGYPTGIVTTTSVTHATPAATYAHVPERDWENDAKMPAEAKAAGCRDIARQLVEFGHGDGLDVILGGGREHFLPAGMPDPEHADETGARSDGRNLVEVWQAGAKGRQYVWNAQQFDKLKPRGQVLGLFEPSHMQFEADRPHDPAGEPSLAAMTEFAIQLLSKHKKPFFLVVEGGRIDHAHHFVNAYRALEDTLAFADAVSVATKQLPADESLILVTADHSHTLTISGYPRRGNPILGKVEAVPGETMKDARGLPYTTLGYANGSTYSAELPDLTEIDTTAPNYRQVAGVPMQVETHAGEDVPAYARGIGAQLVRGVMEQNELYQPLKHALFGKSE